MIWTIMKAVLGILFAFIGFKAVHLLEVSERERKAIRRHAYGDAMDAWAALRQDDYNHYQKELKALKEQLAAKDEIIEQKEQELARWDVIGQAFVTGKGGRLQ